MDNPLRFIETKEITAAVAGLCIKANTILGKDILDKLIDAKSRDCRGLAGQALDTLIENAALAEHNKLPICQDTGMAVVFVSLGNDVHIKGDIESAINEGVRQGYRDGYCRNSIVGDPINRVNTGDNTPAVIYYNFIPGDKVCITVAPKGFGSENMSRLQMFNPSDGPDEIEHFIIDTVKKAGANPCPPIIVGVGIGGTADKAMLMAKQALLRDINDNNNIQQWAQFENILLDKINQLGIGPSGYGGNTTALAVKINTYPTHIAGLPVAVNIGCHATRHCEVTL